MPSKAYESPLIPHARMRALYRALVEVRALSRKLAARRGGLAARTEAPWAACALELREGDLLSCPGGHTALAEHIRAAGVRAGTGRARPSDMARTLAATPLPFSGSEADRLLCAVGAAMALKAAGGGNVVVAFVALDALPSRDWVNLLRLAAEAAIPLVLVALPSANSRPAGRPLPLDRLAARDTQTPMPVIPVDASDPIALYRVATESLGRARAGDGAAVVHAVASAADPVSLLASQLLARGIVTQRWLDAVALQSARAFPLAPSSRSKPTRQRTAAA